MQKPIEMMTDHEMLQELLEEKRRADRVRSIKIAVCAAILIAVAVLCAIYLPPIIEYFRKLNESVQQIRSTLQELRAVTDAVRETVGNLRDAGTERLESALDRINELLEGFPAIFR